MPFTQGTYKHESGFTLLVNDEGIFLSPEHPMSLRLSVLFDSTKWTQVEDEAAE